METQKSNFSGQLVNKNLQYGWNFQVLPDTQLGENDDLIVREKEFVCKEIPVDKSGIIEKSLEDKQLFDQNFEELRDKFAGSKTLFEDPLFPALSSSLMYSREPDRAYKWLRPHEICKDPQFFVDGVSRCDVNQGFLGNCWLISAVVSLTENPKLFNHVVPENNSFEHKYAGIFHFRFWQYGEWVEVVIDDRLPTLNGRLVYMHSNDNNEFWGALFEKAFAKLYGSYEALDGGKSCEGMAVFTGGIIEMYNFEESPPHDLFNIMEKAFQHKSMMSCSINPDPNEKEFEMANGLVKGHCYSLTMAKKLDIVTPSKKGEIQLLRLRNPWGNDTEWRGAFSDNAPQWKFIPEESKKDLNLNFESDGEFWMSFMDFMKNFDHLEICHLCPKAIDFEDKNELKLKFKMQSFNGEWTRGATAGGCRNNLETFWINPQYIITVNETDFEQDTCTVIVALMQKNRRSRKNIQVGNLNIGFTIYKIEEKHLNEKPLRTDFFKYNHSCARSPTFVNLLEVTCRFKFKPGHYLIIPSTYEPHKDGEFLLRIYTKLRNQIVENELEWTAGLSQTKTIFESSELAPVPRDWSQDKKLFTDIAGDDEEVDWMELRGVLNHTMKDVLPNEEFSKDACRSMVAMMDIDHSGMLNFEEFKKLLTDLAFWKSIFKKYLVPGKFYISGYQLRDALGSSGYYINYKLLNALTHRYGTKEGNIDFDDFVICAIKVKTMTEAFMEKSKNGSKEATFTLDDWIARAVYS